MKTRPGDILRNLNPNIGIKFYSKDTYKVQTNPSQPTPIEEVVEEIKPIENELRHTQVEQTEIPSGSWDSREHS